MNAEKEPLAPPEFKKNVLKVGGWLVAGMLGIIAASAAIPEVGKLASIVKEAGPAAAAA